MAHRYVRCFKDGANLHGERFAALVALVSPNAGALAAHLGNALHAAAMRADGAIGPEASLNESVSCFFVVEVLIGQNGLHDDFPLCRNHNLARWVRQV